MFESHYMPDVDVHAGFVWNMIIKTGDGNYRRRIELHKKGNVKEPVLDFVFANTKPKTKKTKALKPVGDKLKEAYKNSGFTSNCADGAWNMSEEKVKKVAYKKKAVQEEEKVREGKPKTAKKKIEPKVLKVDSTLAEGDWSVTGEKPKRMAYRKKADKEEEKVRDEKLKTDQKKSEPKVDKSKVTPKPEKVDQKEVIKTKPMVIMKYMVKPGTVVPKEVVKPLDEVEKPVETVRKDAAQPAKIVKERTKKAVKPKVVMKYVAKAV